MRRSIAELGRPDAWSKSATRSLRASYTGCDADNVDVVALQAAPVRAKERRRSDWRAVLAFIPPHRGERAGVARSRHGTRRDRGDVVASLAESGRRDVDTAGYAGAAVSHRVDRGGRDRDTVSHGIDPGARDVDRVSHGIDLRTHGVDDEGCDVASSRAGDDSRRSHASPRRCERDTVSIGRALRRSHADLGRRIGDTGRPGVASRGSQGDIE